MTVVDPMTDHPSSPNAAHAPPRDLSLRDRLLQWRDGMLGDARFQRFAGTFVLTRPIARRNAGALFDLCAGFVYSQILLSCVRLKLFDDLANGPTDARELARKYGLSYDATILLLDAAAALKLVQSRSKGRYGLGSLGAALRGNPGVVAMIQHHAMLYGDLSDPLALLRGEVEQTALRRYWPYATGAAPLTRDAVGPYTQLMSASQPMIAQQVLAAYSFAEHRCILDVGGGDGTFLSAVLTATPALRGLLFDLPPVADAARQRFVNSDLASRTTAIGGSFTADDLPLGADIVSLIRVIHDHDDDKVMKLLRTVRRALSPGGTLLIAEPISGTPGAEAIGDAYFAFYLLAMGSGRPRRFARLNAMLTEAGFSEVTLRSTPMPMLASVIVARS